jgi:hypothetical protein
MNVNRLVGWMDDGEWMNRWMDVRWVDQQIGWMQRCIDK